MRLDHVTSRRLGLGRVTAVWMLAALLVGGCDMSRLSPFQDKRIRIVEPENRSSVSLPVTLRWEVDEFTITGRDDQSTADAGYFAVFVDRPPIPPGRTLEWFAMQDDSCGVSACGSVDNLEDIYTTEKTSLKLTRLPALFERNALERHEVVIILLDGAGARIGESAFYVRFTFDREV